jgi:hypothetical protein
VFEYHPPDPNSSGELWVAKLKPNETRTKLLRNITSYGTDLSPDGKWLFYASEESGRLEVYVISFNPHASPAFCFSFLGKVVVLCCGRHRILPCYSATVRKLRSSPSSGEQHGQLSRHGDDRPRLPPQLCVTTDQEAGCSLLQTLAYGR